MGARDWMLVYAEREVQSVLTSAPVLDRDANPYGWSRITLHHGTDSRPQLA